MCECVNVRERMREKVRLFKFDLDFFLRSNLFQTCFYRKFWQMISVAVEADHFGLAWLGCIRFESRESGF